MGADGRDSTLAEPFIQVGEYRYRRLPDVAFVATESKQICSENPGRMCLVAQSSNNTWIKLSLASITGAFIPGEQADPMVPTLIHTAAYPVLCGLSWWAWAAAGTTVRVWEVEKLSR